MILMDNDPCQSSVVSREALKGMVASLIKIPARSLDLNPIENILNNIKREIETLAINRRITKETYPEVSQRVIKTLISCDTNYYAKTTQVYCANGRE